MQECFLQQIIHWIKYLISTLLVLRPTWPVLSTKQRIQHTDYLFSQPASVGLRFCYGGMFRPVPAFRPDLSATWVAILGAALGGGVELGRAAPHHAFCLLVLT
jgi:hypothetical protein